MKVINSMYINNTARVVYAELHKEDVDNLLSCNIHNRPLNLGRVDYLKRSIENGEWKFNGATIVVDGDGILRDGQTRLSAFKAAGYPPFETMLVFLNKREDEATAIQKTIDKGQPRRYSQQLKLDGVKNANDIAAIRRQIMVYLGGLKSNSFKKYTDSELDNIGNEYRGEILRFLSLKKDRCVNFTSSALAVICVIAKKYGKSDELYDWCDKIAKCEDLKLGSTQHTFMRMLSTYKGNGCGHGAIKDMMLKTESLVMAHLNGNENMTKVYGKSMKKRGEQ